MSKRVKEMKWVLKFGRDATVEMLNVPDRCPHCGAFGHQTLVEPAKPISTEWYPRELWLAFICPCAQRKCGLPFFAVYKEPGSAPLDRVAWVYAYSTPQKPGRYNRDPNIEAVSPKFYKIMDQALAAEVYRLDLVAGPGYRKALEHLLKDYVAALITERGQEDGKDSADVQKAVDNVKAARKLSQVITLIGDSNLEALTKRATWLGNDETHYERTWIRHDIEQLKKIIWIVVRYIENELAARDVLAEMPDSGPVT